jgi:four helix bundle protein
MSEASEALKQRLRAFALDTMSLFELLPRDVASRYLSEQLLASANGAAANYRAACRGRSRREFVAKIGQAAEEADESSHWLEMLTARRAEPARDLKKLLTESHEIEAILSASYGTARRNLRRDQGQRGPKRGA